MRARAVSVPVHRVARPGNCCCARGRQDSQVGGRPRPIPSFPQSTLASPSLPAAPLPPGCGASCGSARAVRPPAVPPSRGNPLLVTGRSAGLARPGRGTQLAVRGWRSAPAGPRAAGGSAGLWREPQSRGERVPLVPTFSLHAPGSPGVSTGLSVIKRPCILSPGFLLLLLLMGPMMRVFCSVIAAFYLWKTFGSSIAFTQNECKHQNNV